jgi:hypothetical protein
MCKSHVTIPFKTRVSAGCERSGYQVSGNERPVGTALLTGFQIGALLGARPTQLRDWFTKQTFHFEVSQELKGRSDKFKKSEAILSWSLD